MSLIKRIPSTEAADKRLSIAFLDTGISSVEDFILPENRIVAFRDLMNGKTEPYDDNGHGTHVTCQESSPEYMKHLKEKRVIDCRYKQSPLPSIRDGILSLFNAEGGFHHFRCLLLFIFRSLALFSYFSFKFLVMVTVFVSLSHATIAFSSSATKRTGT